MGELSIPLIHKGRWDSLEIIEAMFFVQEQYEPEFWMVESGAIQKALGPFLKAEMIRRNCFLNLVEMTPTKDKESRARSIQARMRAGGVRFDMEASWYPALENEILSFPRGIHDDQVDSLAWLGLGLDKFWSSDSLIELEESEWRELENEQLDQGRSLITGY
jgi:predicted phage terminase large subunit-like protein